MINNHIIFFLKSLEGSYTRYANEVINIEYLYLSIGNFIKVDFKVSNSDEVYQIRIDSNDIKICFDH